MGDVPRSFRGKVQGKIRKWLRRGKPAAGGSPPQPATASVTGGPSPASRRDEAQNSGVVEGKGPEPPAQSLTVSECQTIGSSLVEVGTTHGQKQVADCWTNALSKLDDKQRDIIRDIIQEFNALSPPSEVPQEPSKFFKFLLDDCRARQQKRASVRSQWHINVLGKNIYVRELLDSLIETLEGILHRTEKAATLAVSVDPVHTVAPYLLVRTLLVVSTANSRQESALYMGLEKVLPIVFRCQAYERGISAAHSSRTPEETEGFEMALTNLCACVLSFLCASLEFYKASKPRRTFYALWDPKDIVDFQERSESLEKAVMKEASVNSDHLLMNEIFPRVSDMTEIVKALKEKWSNEERVQTLKWASSIPVEDDHRDRSRTRAEGTCKWILARSEFEKWKDSQSPLILWIHGIPGAGKTRLISYIIDVFGQPSSSPGHQIYAYFYCRREDLDRQDPENILRSFVKQLAAADNFSFSLLHHEYAAKEKSGFLSNELSIDECEKILKGIISSSKKNFVIILDALDECRKETRGVLVSTLDSLVESGLPVKILISSRRDADIKSRLQKKVNIGIEATDNEHDIRTYVMSRIACHMQERSRDDSLVYISPELQQEIIDLFMTKSNGMFLWAKLHLDHILSLGSHSRIKQDLGTLPPDIDETFSEILAGISSEKNRLKHIGLGALRWLLSHDSDCSARDLLAAVCYDVKVDHKTFNPQSDTYANLSFDVEIPTILKACSNLVEYDEDRRTPKFRFIHLSVREYLIKQNWAPAAHAFAAEKCLHSFLDLRPPSLSVSPFKLSTEIALEEWIFHLQQADKGGFVSSTVLVLLEAFVGPPGTVSPYIEALDKGYRGDLTFIAILPNGSYFRFPLNDAIFQAHFVCVVFYLGLEALFDFLLSRGFSTFLADFHPGLNPREFSDKQPGFALSLATTPNMLKQCISFLRTNGDTTAGILWHLVANFRLHLGEWESYDTESSINSIVNSIADWIVKHISGDELSMLLGATINIVLGCRPRSYPQMASKVETTKMLVNRGARPVASSFERPPGYTWLSAHEELFKQGLDWFHDGYVDRYIMGILETLPQASAGLIHELSHIILRPVFSNNSACPSDAEVAAFLRALVSTVAGTVNATVQQEFLSPMLLWTTYMSLARSCHVLLAAGAHATACVTAASAKELSEKYESPLIAACAKRDQIPGDHATREIQRMLLDHGGDVNTIAQSGCFGTALIAACAIGDLELCQTLLGHKADATATCPIGFYGNALVAASCASIDDPELCRTLLDHGADANATCLSGFYGTALIAACVCGNIRVCETLLCSGAKINATCSSGFHRTALIAAASWSRPSRSRISRGTNRWWATCDRPEIQCKDHTEDLHFRLRLCNFLLHHKADANAVVIGDDSDYIGTALIAASLHDDAALCKRLIDCGAKVNAISGGAYTSAFAAAEWTTHLIRESMPRLSREEKVAEIKRAMQLKPGEALRTTRGKVLLFLEEHYRTVGGPTG